MKQFAPYKGTVFTLRQAAKQERINFNLVEMITKAAGHCNLAGEQTDCATMLYELVHYTLSHKVVNVTKNIGERFLKSEMKLRMSNLRLPFCVFEICFEQGLLIPGTDLQMPSCLVISGIDDITMNAIHRYMTMAGEHTLNERKQMFNVLGLPFGAQENKVTVDPELNKLFSIKYRDPTAIPPSAPICHGNVNSDEDEGKEIDEVIHSLPLVATSRLVTKMNELDMKIQIQVMRAIMGALCYMNTAEPDMTDFKFPDRPKMGTIPPKAVVLGRNFSPYDEWAMRAAHFKTLTHERYRRDESGKPRVIWVRPYEVNKDRKPGEKPAQSETLE